MKSTMLFIGGPAHGQLYTSNSSMDRYAMCDAGKDIWYNRVDRRMSCKLVVYQYEGDHRDPVEAVTESYVELLEQLNGMLRDAGVAP